MQRTKIPYLTHTWAPMHGCTPIAPGCENCWAKKMAKRQAHMGNYDPADPFGVVCDESKLDEPLKLRKPATIGTAFMGDLFHKGVPFEYIDKVFAAMALCPQHTFLVFTKRPGRMAEYFGAIPHPQNRDEAVFQQAFEIGEKHKCVPDWSVWSVRYGRGGSSLEWPLPNVHLYTSISDQATADENIPHLLRCPAAVRGISLEPMLEPVDLRAGLKVAWQCSGCQSFFPQPLLKVCPCCGRSNYWSGSHKFNPPHGQIGPGLDHVIVGCESGPGRRECKLEWIESVVEQCQAAGVPVYVKQMELDGKVVSDVNQFPPHLRLRETTIGA